MDPFCRALSGRQERTFLSGHGRPLADKLWASQGPSPNARALPTPEASLIARFRAGGHEVRTRRRWPEGPPSWRLSMNLGMWVMVWVQVGHAAGPRSLSLRTDPCPERPSISVRRRQLLERDILTQVVGVRHFTAA